MQLNKEMVLMQNVLPLDSACEDLEVVCVSLPYLGICVCVHVCVVFFVPSSCVVFLVPSSCVVFLVPSS